MKIIENILLRNNNTYIAFYIILLVCYTLNDETIGFTFGYVCDWFFEKHGNINLLNAYACMYECLYYTKP